MMGWRALIMVMLPSLCGCESAMHDGYQQPKYKPLSAADGFADGRSSRDPVAGAVAYAGGDSADASGGRLQRTSGAGWPASADLDRLQRGQQRFDIYCSPCHGELGDGDGIVPRRGFIHPPSFHSDRLRQVPDGHFLDVIEHGFGAMYAYGGVIEPSDRAAIVAYIRALQFSQYAAIEALPNQDRQNISEAAR